MMQGDQYNIPIEILADDGVTDPTVFDDVEIVIGPLVKTMVKEQISYDTERKVFLFPLLQKESMNMPQKAKAQVRVKLNGSEDVIGVDLGEIDVAKTMSKAVL
ncbi:MAG: hypothetical protein IIW86_00060 [Clostridia bacterium]|nr:hypothetical protein [Clostridia bacterium]